PSHAARFDHFIIDERMTFGKDSGGRCPSPVRALEDVCGSSQYAAKDVESLGLSLTDFGILEALLHKGPLPVNDIGREVDDRRARVVHLTAAGRKLIERAFSAHSESMNRL